MSANLKKWLLAEAGSEPIIAVVLGGDDDAYSHSEPVECGGIPRYAEQPRKRVLSWEDAAPWCDYDFDSGYGHTGCQPVYAWTPTRVITIGEYDGATICQSLPRNPIKCEPEYR